MKKGKVLLGALLAVALVAGLYWVNRYWIEPALHRAKASGKHPVAPNFSLTDLSGQKLNLSDYNGKVILLDFWATWCGPCLIEIPGFVELQNRYRDQGFAVIGIAMQDKLEAVRDFYREYKMNYRVAMGNDELEELFGGIFGLPTTFLIGRDGRVYAKHVGATDVAVFEEEVKKLLAAEASVEVPEFRQQGRAGQAAKIELGDPEEVNSEVPGVNLSKLTTAQKEQFKKQLSAQKCDCGCNMDLLNCRLKDRQCSVSRKLARAQLEKFSKRPV